MARKYQHGSVCILIFEDAGEPVTEPVEGGYVVCRFGNGYGAFWMDGAETRLVSGTEPKPSVESALELALQIVDQDVDRRAASERRSQERALAEVPQAPRPEDAVYWDAGGEPVSVPVELMLRLLNALPRDSGLREEALKALVEFKDPFSGGNGAILHAIVRTPTGELVLDLQRYSVAVYRRKQARYAKELMDRLSKVSEDIGMVNGLLDDERQAESVQGVAAAGEPLLDLPPRPVDAFEAVNQTLRPALTDASEVHRRIKNSE